MIGSYYYTLADQDLTLGPPRVKPIEDGKYEVTFRYRPRANAESVFLAGAFNDWKADREKMKGPDTDGFYSSTIVLEKGYHEYKFVIDGKIWKQDPGNRAQTGLYHNSVVSVGK
jgi:1,4-alpha-glucan branching enzyme